MICKVEKLEFSKIALAQVDWTVLDSDIRAGFAVRALGSNLGQVI